MYQHIRNTMCTKTPGFHELIFNILLLWKIYPIVQQETSLANTMA